MGRSKKSLRGTCLDTYVTDDLPIGSAGLILQKEVAIKQREIGRNNEEGFTMMNKDDYLKD
jgi:hypothetical protein